MNKYCKSGFSFLESPVASMPLEKYGSRYEYLLSSVLGHQGWLCTSARGAKRGLSPYSISIQVSLTTVSVSDLKEKIISCPAHLSLLHHFFYFSKPTPSNMVSTSHMWPFIFKLNKIKMSLFSWIGHISSV